MTLLETVIAFVLLAVVGVACLDLARGATGLETQSVEWTRAVAVGESAMAAAAANVRPDDRAFTNVRVARRPWRNGEDDVDVIDVSVTLPSGAVFRSSRLVRASRGETRGKLP